MNPGRPRKPRQDGAALRYLDRWRAQVERTERIAREGGYSPTDCPCCDAFRPDDARERLEGLMRNGIQVWQHDKIAGERKILCHTRFTDNIILCQVGAEQHCTPTHFMHR